MDDFHYARTSRGDPEITLLIDDEGRVEIHYDNRCEAEFGLDQLQSGRLIPLPRGISVFVQWMGVDASEPFDLRIDGDTLFRTRAEDEDPRRNIGLAGVMVVSIGALQLLAAVFLEGAMVPLLVSGGLLVAIGLVFLRTWSAKVMLVGAVVTGVQLAVFVVLLLEAPMRVPRIVILGTLAAMVSLVMGYRGAKELEQKP